MEQLLNVSTSENFKRASFSYCGSRQWRNTAASLTKKRCQEHEKNFIHCWVPNHLSSVCKMTDISQLREQYLTQFLYLSVRCWKSFVVFRITEVLRDRICTLTTNGTSILKIIVLHNLLRPCAVVGITAVVGRGGWKQNLNYHVYINMPINGWNDLLNPNHIFRSVSYQIVIKSKCFILVDET